jgi:hypothetical protein
VEEGSGGSPTVLATVPIVAGTNDGWQRLRLSVVGGTINANFGGTFGNPLDGNAFNFLTVYGSVGSVYMGYREGVPGVINARPLMVDRLELTSPNSLSCGPQYQLNQAAASLTLDAVVGGIFTPAITTRCFGTQGVITFSSTQVGLPWDAAISFDALVPASGGLVSGGGQIINLNFITPTLPFVWLNGGSAPDFATTSFPVPTFSAYYTTPSASASASIQMGCFNPASVDFVSLSQGCQLDIIPVAGSIVHTPADDDTIQVFLPAAPLCSLSTVPFYGTNYSTFFVTSNGRVMFGNATNAWTPSVALAISHGGAVGAWSDYSPQLVPNSLVTSVLPNGNVRVDWSGVPYFGQPGTANTFGVEFEVATGVIHLDVPTLQQDPGLVQSSWVGLSVGNLAGASNLGASAFGPAPQAGFTTAPTEMIYNFGSAGQQTVGVQRISFVPNGIGNYDWVTL